VEKTNPKQLFEIIDSHKEEYAIDLISSRADLSKSTAERIIQYPSFKAKKLDLETIKLEDEISISLNDSGWKTISKLSTGGKCTAILVIAMLERDIPLLIDQPEDSLDNAFIYEAVVNTVRKLKDKRQLLIVTHNANIPILGDCELMFVMKSDGMQGKIKCRGVIDNQEIKEKAQLILEGSEIAFKKRKEKYGI